MQQNEISVTTPLEGGCKSELQLTGDSEIEKCFSLVCACGQDFYFSIIILVATSRPLSVFVIL